MYAICLTSKFKKDYKLAIKRGLKVELLEEVLLMLRSNGSLPPKYKPHLLKGNYKGFWECHVQPVWLLFGNKKNPKNKLKLFEQAPIVTCFEFQN